jgi:CrcB protein
MTAPAFLHSSLLVALGGGVGAWLRYCTSLAWSRAIGPIAASAFPWATLTVNLLGSAALGVLAGWFARYGSHTEGWRLFLAVGVLGGFTTFSAFSLEMVLMIERGALAQAGLYASASLLAGIGGLFLGLAVMRIA